MPVRITTAFFQALLEVLLQQDDGLFEEENEFKTYYDCLIELQDTCKRDLTDPEDAAFEFDQEQREYVSCALQYLFESGDPILDDYPYLKGRFPETDEIRTGEPEEDETAEEEDDGTAEGDDETGEVEEDETGDDGPQFFYQ
jgi:hypothetical protein